MPARKREMNWGAIPEDNYVVVYKGIDKWGRFFCSTLGAVLSTGLIAIIVSQSTRIAIDADAFGIPIQWIVWVILACMAIAPGVAAYHIEGRRVVEYVMYGVGAPVIMLSGSGLQSAFTG